MELTDDSVGKWSRRYFADRTPSNTKFVDSGPDLRPAKPHTVRNKPPSGSPNQLDGSSIRPRQPGLIKLEQYKIRYPGLLMQPDTKPISQEQLASEVKSIYAGLTMVETKCIHVDRPQAAAAAKDADGMASPKLASDHWQALIALHRTLVHEHHNFFLASQHPSASSVLRRLAAKYSMPARMWKHGIHSFLELLRRRLPASADHMLSFIYLAYRVMALLHETVPAFEDTWIECLGDLGRYRMAIEDQDVRDRETWTGVARRWYSKAVDRSPSVGRLYHHLAILARLNGLQQLYYYSRSLTCVRPFPSRQESSLTLVNTLLGSRRSTSTTPPMDTSPMQAPNILLVRPSLEASWDPRLYFLSVLKDRIERIAVEWKDLVASTAVPSSPLPEDYTLRGQLWTAYAFADDRFKDERAAPAIEQRHRRQRYIPLSMRDQEIHAFPDNGSELDIVSRRFAKKHQLSVDRGDIRTVMLPNGRTISTKGTATLLFRFQGEKKSFRRIFHVLKNSIHDVVLGRSFLETTETLTTFIHRIKTKAASWFSKLQRVHLLGSIAPRVAGSINGAFVDAVDDIGSDVNVISLKEARRLGLSIQTDEAYRTLLGFADGSQAFTYGTVVGIDWRFGTDASSESIKMDFHVLPDLNCDVILSNDFLFDNEAYSSHILLHPVEPTVERPFDEPASFGMIMDLSHEKSALEGLVTWFRSQPTNADPESVDPETKAQRELNREVARQLYHQERIEGLPQAEQQGQWRVEMVRRKKWADDFTLAPATVSASQGSSSIGSASSEPSSTAAVPPKGRFGIRRIGKALKSLNER
jgi:hypothetical protein